MFTVVRYSTTRSFSTLHVIETTSAPEIPRRVFDASATAASAALAKLSGDEPMIVMTLATLIRSSFREAGRGIVTRTLVRRVRHALRQAPAHPRRPAQAG